MCSYYTDIHVWNTDKRADLQRTMKWLTGYNIPWWIAKQATSRDID